MSPARRYDIVALTVAVLVTADVATSIADGVARAKVVLESGAARAKLYQFITATQRLKVEQ
jgi:anthranilate phosphoribosyltransferase